MATEIFTNQASTTVSSGGTDAPSSGTSQTWTVASSALFPAASSGAGTQFHIADVSPSYASELVAVTNVSGTTWTVTRGAEGTTPVAHAAGFGVYQVTTAGFLNSLLPGAGTLTGYIAPHVVTLTDGSSVAIDASQGNDFRWTLGAASHTLAAPSNPVNGESITIAVRYSGSYTPLFNAVFDFGAAGQPSWTATSGKTDYVGFRFDSALNSGAGAWAYQGSMLGFTS